MYAYVGRKHSVSYCFVDYLGNTDVGGVTPARYYVIYNSDRLNLLFSTHNNNMRHRCSSGPFTRHERGSPRVCLSGVSSSSSHIQCNTETPSLHTRGSTRGTCYKQRSSTLPPHSTKSYIARMGPKTITAPSRSCSIGTRDNRHPKRLQVRAPSLAMINGSLRSHDDGSLRKKQRTKKRKTDNTETPSDSDDKPDKESPALIRFLNL